MTHPKHPPAAEQGASTGSRAEAAREREISAEQEVVDRAYRELDRQLTRKSLCLFQQLFYLLLASGLLRIRNIYNLI